MKYSLAATSLSLSTQSSRSVARQSAQLSKWCSCINLFNDDKMLIERFLATLIWKLTNPATLRQMRDVLQNLCFMQIEGLKVKSTRAGT